MAPVLSAYSAKEGIVIEVRLPSTYGEDAADRFPSQPDPDGTAYEMDVIESTRNVMVARVNLPGLKWLVGDAEFYADPVHSPEFCPTEIRRSAKRAAPRLREQLDRIEAARSWLQWRSRG